MQLLRPVSEPYRIIQGRGEEFINEKTGKPMYASMWFKWHMGIDYAGPIAGVPQEVFSAQKGIIVQNNYLWAWGNFFVIRHENWYETIYAHLSKKEDKKVGQTVGAGEFLGLSWASGNVTGVHLHFGYRPAKDHKDYNYQNWFQGWIDPTSFIVWQLDSVELSDYEKEFISANQYLVDHGIYNGVGEIDTKRLVIMLARILYSFKK